MGETSSEEDWFPLAMESTFNITQRRFHINSQVRGESHAASCLSDGSLGIGRERWVSLSLSPSLYRRGFPLRRLSLRFHFPPCTLNSWLCRMFSEMLNGILAHVLERHQELLSTCVWLLQETWPAKMSLRWTSPYWLPPKTSILLLDSTGGALFFFT